MKNHIITAVVIAGAVISVAGCSVSAKPANNDLNTIAPPVPETSATLVPGPNHHYDVGGGVGVESNSGIGGAVGHG